MSVINPENPGSKFFSSPDSGLSEITNSELVRQIIETCIKYAENLEKIRKISQSGPKPLSKDNEVALNVLNILYENVKSTTISREYKEPEQINADSFRRSSGQK